MRTGCLKVVRISWESTTGLCKLRRPMGQILVLVNPYERKRLLQGVVITADMAQPLLLQVSQVIRSNASLMLHMSLEPPGSTSCGGGCLADLGSQALAVFCLPFRTLTRWFVVAVILRFEVCNFWKRFRSQPTTKDVRVAAAVCQKLAFKRVAYTHTSALQGSSMWCGQGKLPGLLVPMWVLTRC